MNLDQVSYSVGMRSQSMFKAADMYPHWAQTVTVELAKCDEAVHYPDGYLKPGIILALQSGGSGDGLWAPLVENSALGFDLEVPAAMVWSGFEIETSGGAAVGTQVMGAALLAGFPVMVDVARLPGLLAANGTTPVVVDAANLPAGFIAWNLGG